MTEKLNIRFLIILFVVAAILVGGWTAVHAYQVRSNSSALLTYAERAEATGRPDRAARLLDLYIEAEPGDVNARAHFGHLIDQSAKLPQDCRRVVDIFERVLDQDPSRHDIRHRVIDRALEIGLLDTATHHLDILRQEFPKDATTTFQLGQCREVRGEYNDAARWYRETIKLSPGNLSASLQLARILRTKQNKASDADAVIDAMVKANQGNFHAYLARARTRRDLGQFTEAFADINEALRLAPNDPDVCLLAADLATRQNQTSDVARGYLRHVLKQRPDDPRVYESLAAIELRDNKINEALAYFDKGLASIPGQPNLLWNKANLLIGIGRVDEARPIVDKLVPNELPAGRVEFLRSALKIKDGFWREAGDTLETIRPSLSAEPDLAMQAELLLGQCWRMVGDDDRAILAYRRAISLNPTNPAARFGIVLALFNQGRPDTALTECEDLMRLPHPPATGWPLLARLRIQQNLSLPSSQRRWELVDAALREADKSGLDSPQITLLRAEAQIGRGQLDEARRLLEAARDKTPKEIEYWIALVELADRTSDTARAATLLDEAGKKAGDGVELRLARARHLVLVPGKESIQALVQLSDGASQFHAQDRIQLLSGLAGLLNQAGRGPDALQLWKQVSELEPKSLSVRLAVFDLALSVRDDALMGETLEAIRQIEGSDGSLWQYNQARRLLATASKGDKERAAEARALLTQLANKRPAWSRIPLAIAWSYELEGNLDQAIEHYRKAIDLGERQLTVVRQVVEMLIDRGRYVDADQIIRKLPEQTLIFANLQRRAAEVSLQTNDASRALAYALKAVSTDSKDPKDQRWLGQILWATRRFDEAEHALRRSVELAERDPAGWVALVQFYARTGQKNKAEETIGKAETKVEKKAAASLALAQCYAAVGKFESARKLFEAALKDRPDDIVVLQSVADFDLRTGKREEAKTILRKLVASKVKDSAAADQAQKLLAVVLAAGGNYQDSREALALMGLLKNAEGRSTGTGDDSIDEQRTRAVVLASQPHKSQQQDAIRILEELNRHHPLSNEDQYLLAQLYERVGDTTRARDRMLKLLAAEGDNPRYLSHQVHSLLRQGHLNDARLWLEKLEQVLPDALSTIELKARVLNANGQSDEAESILKARAKSDDPGTVYYIGGLLEELGRPAAAEECFRRYATMGDKVEGPLQLARFLGRRHRLDEALHLCETALQSTAPERAGYACLSVLRSGKAGDADCQRVEGWLTSALQKNPDSIGMVICLADLRDLRRQYDESVALYRQVLKNDPRNLVALNNLAWQLALREGFAEESLSLANLALEIGGPQPALLDTRALARLANQNANEALADLDDAFSPDLERSTLASIRFHQSRAHLLEGKRTEAIKAFREAREAGLDEANLHPLEVATYRELTALR